MFSPPCNHTLLIGRRIEVGLAILKKHSLKANEISGTSAIDANAKVTDKVLTVDTLLEPIAPEDVGLVRCLGLNYKDHAVCKQLIHLCTKYSRYILQAEAKMAIPECVYLYLPYLSSKPTYPSECPCYSTSHTQLSSPLSLQSGSHA